MPFPGIMSALNVQDHRMRALAGSKAPWLARLPSRIIHPLWSHGRRPKDERGTYQFLVHRWSTTDVAPALAMALCLHAISSTRRTFRRRMSTAR